MPFLDKAIKILDQTLAFVAGLTLVAMILLVTGNIILRVVWLPIRGTFELLGFFGAIVATFALGYTQRFRMHISVDILVEKFSLQTRKVLNFINYLLCMTFFFLAAWRITVWSGVLVEVGEVTETLQIIFYPFTYAAALGCLVLALTFLLEILRVLFPSKEVAK